MSKRAAAIELTDAERVALEKISRAPKSSQEESQRARIILMAASGMQNKDIAEKVGLNRLYVGLWRRRFQEKRTAGLKNLAGKGRKRVHGHDARLKVAAICCETGSSGQRKTIEEIAKETGLTWSTVQRILRAMDLKPWKVEEWLTSRDPEFESKAAEICGLYLNPPPNALVICADEKTGIQALGRKNEDKPARPKSPLKREFEYVRHGTQSLLAAFIVHSGQVIAEVKERHTRVEFLEFLEGIHNNVPEDKMIHVILDNLQVHKTLDVNEWLARHLRFKFHFTPTHASWLNQVELWFSILSRKLTNRGVFNSKEELVAALVNFVEEYNKNAKPFRWTYESDPLRA